jgi:hypothetical protein
MDTDEAEGGLELERREDHVVGVVAVESGVDDVDLKVYCGDMDGSCRTSKRAKDD